MQRFQNWRSRRNQRRQERQQARATRIAHRLWEKRTGGDRPQVEPEAAAKAAALQDWQMGERIAANPLRRLIWWGSERLDAFNQSPAPTVRFIRFFVWEIPQWNIKAVKLFFQSDLVKVLAVPVVAASFTAITAIDERREQEQIRTIDEYLNQIDTLTFEHGLLSEEPSPGAIVLARGRTIAALQKLDLKRRRELIAFIRASGLHQKREGAKQAVISFRASNLRRINLAGVELRDFPFEGADLGDANLKGTDLEGANLSVADLGNANLRGASLRAVNLKGADLEGANLSVADLGNANLRGASLWAVNLKGADLEGANLSVADLGNANLREANLRFANLREANLGGANLKGADLEEANLEGASFCGTTMPDGRFNTICPSR